MSLKPELAHNRAAFDRVATRRWPVIGVAGAVGVLIAFLAPVDRVLDLLIPSFWIFVAALGAIEFKLV